MTDIRAAFFDRRTILVTGGTGSLGQAILARFRGHSVRLRVYSRDEAKQDALRVTYPDVEFVTGDVRDPDALTRAMLGADYVFHAAALKQVPNCERFPDEAVKTNVLGAANLVAAARSCLPLAIVAVSTDKAVEPLNVMGLTKALMERIVLGQTGGATRMVAVRYGNVVASRGSVVPAFLAAIDRGEDLSVTDPEMTRFLIPLEDAVDLVLNAATNGSDGDLWVRKMPAATVGVLADACLALRQSRLGVRLIGIRPGEKVHEVLVTSDEMRRAEERPDRFVVRAHWRSGPPGPQGAYTSSNTQRLGVSEVVDLLRRSGVA